MKIRILFVSIVCVMYLVSCSSSEESTKKVEETNTRIVKKFRNDVNLNIQKNASWVNLMPGTQPKFHVTGKLDLLEGENYDPLKTELKFIKIYQNEEELYYIMPKVIEEISGDTKILTFSTLKGLSINKNLDTKNPVVFEFIFKQDNNELKYRDNNVLVEEVH
ncbi:MAG: hypothetical protein H6609_15510 [Ignavibacteriales bacterium]|nr:hypothetical protein [Ignavibacteriales bacterium]